MFSALLAVTLNLTSMCRCHRSLPIITQIAIAVECSQITASSTFDNWQRFFIALKVLTLGSRSLSLELICFSKKNDNSFWHCPCNRSTQRIAACISGLSVYLSRSLVCYKTCQRHAHCTPPFPSPLFDWYIFLKFKCFNLALVCHM